MRDCRIQIQSQLINRLSAKQLCTCANWETNWRYRLISVGSGDFESGNATILASEDGYIPWWQTKSDNFKPIDQFVRSTMSRADLDAESVEVIGLYLMVS